MEKFVGELLGHALELLDRLTGDRHVHAGRSRAGAVDRPLQGEPVRRDQLDGTVVRSEHCDLVLDQLGAVLADQAADEDGVGPGRLDLLVERLIRRCLRVVRVETGDLDPERLRRVLEVRRDAEAVRLLVVEDEDVLDADRLRELGVGSALVGVVGDDARVVARAGRVVLVRLGLVARQARLRQADVACSPARSSRCRRPAPG